MNLTSIKIVILIWLLLPFSSACSADKLSDLLGQVEKLNISRQGYTLGKALTKEQRATALRHPEEAANPLTFKFKDGDIHVVADKASDRVVILYGRYEAATLKSIQGLVGSLSLEFGDPTVMAHDKIIYWAFGPDGKLTRDRYKKVKEADGKLNILATVKLNSSMEIVGDSAFSEKGSVYYVISSEPALKLMETNWK